MENKMIFEKFNKGNLLLPNKEVSFEEIIWSNHPAFEGVEPKHIITSKETNCKFSFHLVRIAPKKMVCMYMKLS